MDNTIKKYELSLWDDSPVDGEVRRCVIASDTMSSPAKAYNITLNRKSNGERVLTFSIVARYFDQEIEDFVTNPYLSFLTNERKVKLRREEKEGIKWYDFIIKDVAEDSSNQTYTYTAKDQHVQELAKSGFALEFDKELKNNTGTKEELAEAVLKGTDWGIGNGTELLEYTKEPVYRGIITDASIQFKPLLEQNAEPFNLEGKYAYVVYHYYTDSVKKTQILYSPLDCEATANSKVNDEGVLDRKLYQILAPINEITSASKIFDSAVLCPGLQGERLVQTQKTVYDTKLEQYVKVYSDNKNQDKNVYGFTKTEYNTPELVENLITNGEGDFINESGWYNTSTATRVLGFDPPVSEWSSEDISSFIKVKQEEGAGECWIVNTGLYNNRTKIPGFTSGQEYYFDCTFHNNGELYDIKICEYSFQNARYVPNPNGKVLFSGLPNEDKRLTCLQTIGSEELKTLKIGIFLQVSDGAEISKCQLYRYINGVEPGSVSTLEPEDLIKTHYYYYDSELSYTNFEDMEFLYEGYEEQDEQYVPVFEGYEKKRTITGKESNRYNLLQEICEQFECWLRFDIEHDTNGKILSKAVSFHEYAGDNNYAGFKYGINLKSIKRNIDSNQIVTKMITKDNSNEFAKNGFCSIARAPSNPSGTNVIYNFDYYVSQGLLSAEEVSNALYLTSQTQPPELPENVDWSTLGDIEFPKEWGLYSKLDHITSFTQSTTEEQIGISKNLTSLKASIDFEQARLEGAESSLVELEEDLQKLTGYAYEQFLTAIAAEDRIEPPEGGELTEEDKEHNRFVDWALSDEVRDYKVKIRHLRKEKQQAEKILEELLQVSYDNSYIASYSDEQKKLTLSSYSGEGQIQKVWFFENFTIGRDLSLNVVSSDSFNWYITEGYRGPGTYDIDSFGSSDTLVLPKNRSLIVVTQADNVWLRDKGLLFEQRSFQCAYDLNIKKLEYYNNQRKKVEEEFYQKYARFIQEGSWISEDYIDDELYYLDALATSYTSSRPKVSYTIDVFDLARIEGYENYEFQIGDKTFVEDAEFFGYKLETIKDPQDSKNSHTIRVPIREEVIVSEMTEGIDDITKNTIKVKNYKTQFDDLFQRIAATTESLQYNTGRYERGAKAVEPDGSISHKALQQAVTENGLAIANAGAQTVTIDEQGVVTTDKTLPNKKVRIIGGGIYVTKDGGETWETGITGDGINANVITTGQLNTGEVNIMTGDTVSHRWDNKGITAYQTTYTTDTGKISSINNATFVRFDEFGFYGIKNNPDFNARLFDEYESGIEKIKNKAAFSFTWEGVTIGKQDEGLELTDEGLYIGNKQFGFKASSEGITIGGNNGLNATKSGITIGGNSGLNATESGITIGGESGLRAEAGGLIIGNSSIWLSPFGYQGTVEFSDGDSKTAAFVIFANGSFGVATDGNFYATKGRVGGWKIENNKFYSESNIAYFEEDEKNPYVYSAFMQGYDDNDHPEVFNSELYAFGIVGKRQDETLKYPFFVRYDGFLKATNAEISGKITTTDASIGNWKVGDYSLKGLNDSIQLHSRYKESAKSIAGSPEKDDWRIVSTNFGLDSQGNLYANNATVTGSITATSGYIGENNEIKMSSDGIYGGAIDKWDDWSLTKNGFYLNKNAKIRLGGNFSLVNEDDGGKIEVSGPLTIGTQSGIGLSFQNEHNATEETIVVSVFFKQVSASTGGIYLSLSKTMKTDLTINLKYRTVYTDSDGTNEQPHYPKDGTLAQKTLMVPAGQKTSQIYAVDPHGYLQFDYCYLIMTYQNKDMINTKEPMFYSGSNIYDKKLQDPGDEFLAEAFSIKEVTTTGDIKVIGNLTSDGNHTLGTEKAKWNTVYLSSSPIISSDRNEKELIEQLPKEYETLFDNLLPVRYKFIVNDSNRYHVGFISQEVESALKLAEIPSSDFAGFISYKKENGEIGYGLRYEEFIALNTCEIQKLKQRVTILEREIKLLKEKI